MKRDANIILFSRDHHYGLLFCWKIRQGLTKRVESARIRRYVLHFWASNLDEHFAEEETLLFNDRSDNFCVEAKQQHTRIRSLIHAIEGSETPGESVYRDLADEVDRHIRFEERQVFPYLEENMTPDELAAVGDKLRVMHTRPADDIYDDAFWT